MLSAELAANHDPGARAAILARYGVEGPAALIALGGHWQQRLQSDPAAAAVWKATYTQHRGSLKGPQR